MAEAVAQAGQGGELGVGVGVDQPGRQQLAAAIDDPRAGRDGRVAGPYRDDPAIADQDVAAFDEARRRAQGQDGGIGDQQTRHKQYRLGLGVLNTLMRLRRKGGLGLFAAWC